MLHELRRIREAPVEPEELAETRGYLVGVFPYSLQTVGDVTRRLETLTVFGLPDDYYDALPGADRGGHPRARSWRRRAAISIRSGW